MSQRTLLIAYDVIEFIEKLPRKQQLALRKRFLEICAYPANKSDYAEPDSLGRHVDINICGKFAIKYWDDGADKHLKILDVHSADRLA